MSDRLFGLETEYAVTPFTGETSSSRSDALSLMMRIAHARLGGLPGARSSGTFLPNGSRLYLDHGMHPELSTPECVDPGDAVRYVEAGDRLLDQLAAWTAAESKPGTQVLVFKSNVDYAEPAATWGCHESYLHRADPAAMRKRIVSHLVSRIVYTGAGGFNPRSEGLEFMLSPRAVHLLKVFSHDSTGNRGIVHVKDESLSPAGWARLHIICGESVRSQTAAWLKSGVTALVVALIEAGYAVRSRYEPKTPLEALVAFARDTTCTTRVPTVGGTDESALSIQRAWLELAESHLHAAFMPRWAGEVCRRWRMILDRLEAGPGAVCRTLDWSIKLHLFQARARRRGFDWEQLGRWPTIVSMLRTILPGVDLSGSGWLDGSGSGLSVGATGTASAVRALARVAGIGLDGVPAFLRMRDELFEADVRFGQVGSKSLFAELDRKGVLDHRVESVGPIDPAMTAPPPGSRAAVRGNVVRRLASRQRCRAEWWAIWDNDSRRVLDLTDPFARAERWVSPGNAWEMTYESPDELRRQAGGGPPDGWPGTVEAPAAEPARDADQPDGWPGSLGAAMEDTDDFIESPEDGFVP